MKRILAALAAAIALAGCGSVGIVDPERYKLGYEAGLTQLAVEGTTPEHAVELCSTMADLIAAQAGWDETERLDYMLGCQDSAHGRPSDYE